MKKILLIWLPFLSYNIYAEQFDIHAMPKTDYIYLYGNGYRGWDQHNFINNSGQVACTKSVSWNQSSGYNSSYHCFVWDVKKGTNVDITPSQDDDYDYYCYAFNDRKDMIYQERKKNSGSSTEIPIYQYSLNNNRDFLEYYDYSYCRLIENRGGSSNGGRVTIRGTMCLFLNDNRTIAGFDYDANTSLRHAVRISNVVNSENYNKTVLPMVSGAEGSMATDINNSDNIVGWNYRKNGTAKAVLWTNNSVVDLGIYGRIRPEYVYSGSDIYINDNNLIACMTNTGMFLWEDGQVLDLTGFLIEKLLSANFPNGDLSWIQWGEDIQLLDFSNYGMLLYDRINNNVVVLEIIPEPATMLLLGLGGLLFRRKN